VYLAMRSLHLHRGLSAVLPALGTLGLLAIGTLLAAVVLMIVKPA
jgi:hypothetical protein